jgi:hypothetical protein
MQQRQHMMQLFLPAKARKKKLHIDYLKELKVD